MMLMSARTEFINKIEKLKNQTKDFNKKKNRPCVLSLFRHGLRVAGVSVRTARVC